MVCRAACFLLAVAGFCNRARAANVTSWPECELSFSSFPKAQPAYKATALIPVQDTELFLGSPVEVHKGRLHKRGCAPPQVDCNNGYCCSEGYICFAVTNAVPTHDCLLGDQTYFGLETATALPSFTGVGSSEILATTAVLTIITTLAPSTVMATDGLVSTVIQTSVVTLSATPAVPQSDTASGPVTVLVTEFSTPSTTILPSSSPPISSPSILLPPSSSPSISTGADGPSPAVISGKGTGLTGGDIAGVVVGVAAAVAATMLALFLLWRRKQKKKSKKERTEIARQETTQVDHGLGTVAQPPPAPRADQEYGGSGFISQAPRTAPPADQEYGGLSFISHAPGTAHSDQEYGRSNFISQGPQTARAHQEYEGPSFMSQIPQTIRAHQEFFAPTVAGKAARLQADREFYTPAGKSAGSSAYPGAEATVDAPPVYPGHPTASRAELP